MKVKVFGHHRRNEFGFEYIGELIYECGQFFVIVCEHSYSYKPIRHTFHRSTHGYEEEFVPPFEVGSYVHMTNKNRRDDSSFQKDPYRVYGYVKTDKGWAIEIGDFSSTKKYLSNYPLNEYDIVQIPQAVVDAYARGV